MDTLPEHGEVKVLVLEVDIQTPGEIGNGGVDPLLVFLVDYAVLVEVLPADTAKTGAALGSVVVNLVLALEDAVVDIAYLGAHGMTHNAFNTVAAEGSLGCDGLWKLGHGIAVCADISGDVVLEVANLSAVSDVEFQTLVVHLTGVYPL